MEDLRFFANATGPSDPRAGPSTRDRIARQSQQQRRHVADGGEIGGENQRYTVEEQQPREIDVSPRIDDSIYQNPHDAGQTVTHTHVESVDRRLRHVSVPNTFVQNTFADVRGSDVGDDDNTQPPPRPEPTLSRRMKDGEENQVSQPTATFEPEGTREQDS